MPLNKLLRDINIQNMDFYHSGKFLIIKARSNASAKAHTFISALQR